MSDKFFTPLISILSVPHPLIFAPILFKNFARSSISGSFAAFVNIVVPSPKQDARIMFSVAPTLGKSKLICVPFILSALHLISPYSSFISTPNFSNPFKCKSIGLEPISHPPVCDSLWIHKLQMEC